MGSKKEKKQHGGSITGNFTYIILLCFSLVASYLNWNCMSNHSLIVRVITTMLSFFLAIYYLIFYLVFKVIMGQTC